MNKCIDLCVYLCRCHGYVSQACKSVFLSNLLFCYVLYINVPFFEPTVVI